MKIKFYGVRGSVPSPLTGQQVEDKIVGAINRIHALQHLDSFKSQEDVRKFVQQNIPFDIRSTYGGNTTCVEINVDGYPIICDMGTGIREQGKAMMPQIFANKGIVGTILQSHVHWDHIQGLPFWAPIFLPRTKFNNKFQFFGGKKWDSKLEEVLQGQMSPPVSPVYLEELQHTGMEMSFNTIWDGWGGLILQASNISVSARKLFHPQETFGYKIQIGDNKIVFTTDHEPYADGIPNGLRDLVNGADIWITDCQYSHEMYVGEKDGVQKMGWGHSYPEYIAKVAKECAAKKIITTHHDPSSSDLQIEDIARTVEGMSNIPTDPAYEGLEIEL